MTPQRTLPRRGDPSTCHNSARSPPRATLCGRFYPRSSLFPRRWICRLVALCRSRHC